MFVIPTVGKQRQAGLWCTLTNWPNEWARNQREVAQNRWMHPWGMTREVSSEFHKHTRTDMCTSHKNTHTHTHAHLYTCTHIYTEWLPWLYSLLLLWFGYEVFPEWLMCWDLVPNVAALRTKLWEVAGPWGLWPHQWIYSQCDDLIGRCGKLKPSPTVGLSWRIRPPGACPWEDAPQAPLPILLCFLPTMVWEALLLHAPVPCCSVLPCLETAEPSNQGLETQTLEPKYIVLPLSCSRYLFTVAKKENK